MALVLVKLEETGTSLFFFNFNLDSCQSSHSEMFTDFD